jgi:hypothetical protein
MEDNVSNYLELMNMIYIDSCSLCIADVSSLPDLDVIRARVKKEGLSFLTITLPKFASDFEQALASGYIGKEHFRAFRKYRAIPHFLKGMLCLLFDYETGRLHDEVRIASVDIPSVVQAVRQICMAFKKIELPCAPKRNTEAIENFVSVEATFHSFSLSEDDISHFRNVSFMLWSSILQGLTCESFVPKHGPGATADKISGNQKYVWRSWHDRLEQYFPIIGNGYSVSVDSERLLKNVAFMSPEQEHPSRVALVPKTLKGPRIIALEPHCMQYVQQGIQAVLTDRIESNWRTRGKINFRDQSINQSHALMSSRDGLLATVDLSDASDRVPLSLVKIMLESNPEFLEAVLACRSTRAILPDGRVISLLKFASMGSALCFPVESMYFYTVVVATLLQEAHLPVTRRNIMKVSRRVRVYGDDILIPTTHAIAVLDGLQKYNCKINHNKTFYSGKFRESCGVDAYDGTEVTPTYVRTRFPKNRQQAKELISWCSMANQFYLKGFWNTATYCFKVVERHLGSLPYVSSESPLLGRQSFLGYRSIGRWNSRYHRFEVKGWVPTPVYRTDELDGYGALMKTFQRPQERSILPLVTDRDHLMRSALHGVAALKRRWVPSP